MLSDPVVQSGLLSYLEKIPPTHEQYFGFSERIEFQKTTFGRPLQLYCINYDSLDYASNAIRKLDIWYIPVVVDDCNRCFLYVQELESSLFRVVGIGSNEIANDINNYEKSYSKNGLINEAMVIDEGLNLLFMVTENEKFYALRPGNSCSSCEFDELEGITKKDFLAFIKFNYQNER